MKEKPLKSAKDSNQETILAENFYSGESKKDDNKKLNKWKSSQPQMISKNEFSMKNVFEPLTKSQIQQIQRDKLKSSRVLKPASNKATFRDGLFINESTPLTASGSDCKTSY